MTEADCIARNLAPSPFADNLGNLYASGASLLDVAQRFKIDVIDAAMLISWSLKTKLRGNNDHHHE